MLECKYCDYYRTSSIANNEGEKAIGFCEFTKFVFPKDVEELNIGYPCIAGPYGVCAGSEEAVAEENSFEER